ncbi:thiol-disulfide oxidoreductase DCC family protein [Caulobacter segnis]|uniref:thiol-disulfide oxidoreductase DCC family protein n=1 Tax=Caulobacter segnis TaxID=88688 RepID=UPI0028652875|nr:thiol-disulfide oxidoreductase DCC family protein [Caulobacter segnis]MDR6624907.1 putative DCC family thiol-disulfide oxidoreductase YuxK [Caulobacter segnis]
MTPGPVREPDGLMLFDGVCNLCDGAVRAVMAIDRDGAIHFTPLQTPYGQKLATLYGVDPASPESLVFLDQGRALTKTAAVAAILRRARAPWRWLAIIDRLPRGLTDRVYDGIARNRYRLFGRRERCVVATESQRARFLTEEP